MASTRSVLVAATAVTLLITGAASPSFAGEKVTSWSTQRLDAAPADFSQYRYRGYRGGWRGNRGAAVAAGVGLGLLGAAAIAANRSDYYGYGYDDAPAYGYHYGPGYGYGSYAPVYEQPVDVYRPARQRYYGGRGPFADTYRGAPDPARGGR